MNTHRQHILPSGPHLSSFSEIKVRFSEVDAMGVVWHGNYAKYFEEGREDFGRQYGISFQSFLAAGFYVPVIHFCNDFKGPLRLDQTFILETRFFKQEKAMLETTSLLRTTKDGPLLAMGHTIQLFSDKNGTAVLTMPDILREFYARYGEKFCQ